MTEALQKKLNNGVQYRKMSPLEVREDTDNSMTVEGYATTFGEPYTLYQDEDIRIDEQVDAHAFDAADMSDVIMQYDHQGRVYARLSNGTLELTSDDHGLHVRADLSGTSAGRDLYEEIKGGYTSKMSFGFTVTGDTTEEKKNEDGTRTYLRTITKIGKLYDVSAVSLPANDGTEISARSYIDGVIDAAAAERLEAERRRKVKELQIRLRLEGGIQ